MKRAGAALALAALLCANRAPPLAHTAGGTVRGEALGPGAAFRGIPFGTAVRWRDAAPAPPWKGQRDATAFGPACPQRSEPRRPPLVQSEDCLNLNVITPNRHARNLPVLVLIHGGAYAFGSNRYGADQGLSALVRRGVVLVTPNYRVGRFGFLAHPALTAEAGRGTGNFWLSDQILALRWVKANIARFGGDPARVTIMGCSAGGSSANALMTSPAAHGLFARAAVHSGGGLFNANRPLALAEEQGRAFALRAGVGGTDRQALSALRRLSVQQVLAADPGPPDYGAIIDGHYLPQPIANAYAKGQQASVPLIMGSTSNEASVFGLMGFDAVAMKARFGIDLDAVRPIYQANAALTDAELLRQVQTDFLFTSAALALSGFASARAPAWTYHFDHVPAALVAKVPGAQHCADMPYLISQVRRDDPASQSLAEAMQGYWYNFISHGDPNGAGLPVWPQTQHQNGPVLLVNSGFVPVSGFRDAQLQHWWAKWKSTQSLRE
ncbi:MAG: carboxylesterase/lipase family protein [Novosphingobium sp.]